MILVTGATGLIGSFIVRELINNGYKVKALKRPNSNLSLLSDLTPFITFEEGDILNIPSLEKALENVDYIIHSAGLISFNKRDSNQLYKINVEGTANIVNTSLSFPIKKFVHISSVAAIGKKKSSTYIEETFKWEDNNVSNYAKSKYLGELEVWRGASEGLNVGILNPSVVLGPGKWEEGSTSIFKYIWDKKPFFTKGNVNYVDVRDVATAAINLIESEIQNERFIVNGGVITYKDLFIKIALAFRTRKPSIQISNMLLNILLPLESIRALITNSNPILTKEMVASVYNETIYKNEKAKENLNLTFKKIDETVEWICKDLSVKYKLQINN